MDKHDNDITVKIQTPRGEWITTFPKTTKIGEVINAIVTHFGFATNGKYQLRLASDPNTILEPERPLVSYKIKDNDVLIFTDLGVAV